MNYMAKFNGTWWETCLRDGNSDLFIKRGWPLFGQNKENLLNLQKSSSHELPGQFQRNLVENMLERWGFRLVHDKGLSSFGAK